VKLMPTAFLITPFSPERAGNEQPETFRAVQDAVQQAVKAAGLTLVHPKEMFRAGIIIDQIRDEIERASAILAVLTGENPNVFFELGLARRPAILIARSKEDIPFDVRHMRYWTYGGPGELASLAQRVEIAISETLAEKRRGTEEALEQRMASLVLYPLPRVDGVNPYELLGVTWSDQTDDSAKTGTLPPYVYRDVDPQLDRILKDQKFILVVGPAAAGKSRTAFEALVRNTPRSVLIIPNRPPDPSLVTDIIEAYGILQQEIGAAVLWLDDLSRYLSGAALTSSHLARLATIAELSIMATMRSNEFDRLQRSDDQTGRMAKTVLTRATRIYLPDLASPGESARAKQAYPDLQLVAGLGESFIAGAQLKQRFDYGDSSCVALVKAAVDWRRIGHSWPIPGQHLRTLYWYYYHDLEPIRDVTVEGLEAGLAAAREPVARYSALLIRTNPEPAEESYSALDYIVDYVDRADRAIPEQVWRFMLTQLNPVEMDCVSIGYTAFTRGLLGVAADAWRAGMNSGSAHAALNLGYLLYHYGNQAEAAKEAYQKASDLGDIEGPKCIGYLLLKQGDIEGAKDAFRLGLSRGDGSAGSNLGALLARGGDINGARQAFEAGIRLGNGSAAFNLGMLFVQTHDDASAMHAFETAIKLGSSDGYVGLGECYERLNESNRAVDVWREGVEQKSALAALRLGNILIEAGDRAGAKNAWERGMMAGFIEHSKGGYSMQPSDDPAVASCADALGRLRHEDGELDAAINAFKVAAIKGQTSAFANVGALLSVKGDTKGAEIALRSGMERGDALCARKLGLLLELNGEREEALKAYHNGAELGDNESALLAEGLQRSGHG
jgi:tetratricopeptide (TPR) repeat protein